MEEKSPFKVSDSVMASTVDPFSASYTGQSQTYRASFQTHQMLTPFKLDEGYSEETRSQTGSDAAVEPEFGAGATHNQGPAQLTGLPDWIMALPEQHRSGMFHQMKVHDSQEKSY